MRVCPKCMKRFDDGSKICRDCGAILNPVEDDPVEVGIELAAEREESIVPPLKEISPAYNESEEEPVETSWNPTPWTCSKCREPIEANFDACWNCGTNRNGKEDPNFIRVEGDAMERALPDPPKVKPPKSRPCRSCGSAKVIPNAMIAGYSEVLAKVVGDPDALIFKDYEHAELCADICGECGHVELKVTDPAALYEHYLRSLEPS